MCGVQNRPAASNVLYWPRPAIARRFVDRREAPAKAASFGYDMRKYRMRRGHQLRPPRARLLQQPRAAGQVLHASCQNHPLPRTQAYSCASHALDPTACSCSRSRNSRAAGVAVMTSTRAALRRCRAGRHLQHRYARRRVVQSRGRRAAWPRVVAGAFVDGAFVGECRHLLRRASADDENRRCCAQTWPPPPEVTLFELRQAQGVVRTAASTPLSPTVRACRSRAVRTTSRPQEPGRWRSAPRPCAAAARCAVATPQARRPGP